jgi:hypothetical protein
LKPIKAGILERAADWESVEFPTAMVKPTAVDWLSGALELSRVIRSPAQCTSAGSFANGVDEEAPEDHEAQCGFLRLDSLAE